MTALLLYITIGLAIARLTLILSRDDIFQPIRHLIFLSSPPENNLHMGWEYQNMFPSTKEERENKRLVLTVGRNWLERRWVHSDHIERPPGFIGKMISCPDCLGIWVAAGYFTSYLYLPEAVMYLSYVLAASMVVSLIARRY